MEKYMYIDESGDLGFKGSSNFVIACLIIDDFHSLNRIIKKMRRHKFRRELRKANEIKANKSSEEIKIYLLKKIHELNIKIYCVVLKKQELYSSFLIKDKNKLYNFVSGKLASFINSKKGVNLKKDKLIIRVDKSKGKQFFREDFNNYFLKKLTNHHSYLSIEIYHSYSHAWSGLQFADLIAWSCFQKYEHNNPFYISFIEANLEISSVWKEQNH